MSNNSSMDGEPEEDIGNDFVSDSMDDDSLPSSEEAALLTDPKWAAFLNEDDPPVLVPEMSVAERIHLAEEREKELFRIAQSRTWVPHNYSPIIIDNISPEKESEMRKERYKAWCERLAQTEREKEAQREENIKLKQARSEKYAKLRKEYHTRDYYWKPDPLYALHMRELGYSKIAIDKALFYTDNKSVAKAVEYLKKNPNPTELTKEEVMAFGEEVLKTLRPVKSNKHDPVEQATQKESDMEIEQTSQSLLDDEQVSQSLLDDEQVSQSLLDDEQASQSLLNDDRASIGAIPFDSPILRKGPKEVPKKIPSDDPKDGDEMIEDQMKRGTKRNYAGEKLKSVPSTTTMMPPPATTTVVSASTTTNEMPASGPVPVAKEINLEYKMIFLVNTSLLMDVITLSLEVGKVVANITNELRSGTDDFKIMFDEWMKDGNKMTMYRGSDNEHINMLYESATKLGCLTYLGQCSHYRHVKTPSSTVLGIFGETEKLSIIDYNLEML